MGNAFGTIKDELNKAADKAEEVQAINDAMDRLIELAELRLATFKAELAARDNLHIPIDRILYSDFRIDCQVASNSEGLQKAIGDSIGAFVSGKVVEGVTAITNVALNALLGSMSASSARRQVYAIGVGPLGGVYRVDAQFYMYRFESKGLKDNLKYVLSSGIVISSASVTGMKRNEVKNLIQNTYTHATPEVQRGIYQEVWASIYEDQVAEQKEPALPHKDRVTELLAANYKPAGENKPMTAPPSVPGPPPAPPRQNEAPQPDAPSN